jgi:hypothetical protein
MRKTPIGGGAKDAASQRIHPALWEIRYERVVALGLQARVIDTKGL